MKASKQDLKKLDRLIKRSDFLLVNSKGSKWVAKGLILLALPNDLGLRRVGFTVTKKLEKSAVGRNRMKRRLRAAAADILPNQSRNAMDYVLIARRDTATRVYTDLQKDLRWCLEKMDLLHG